eukprot:2274534-Pyramimonas_sp.AAC.1
MPATWVFQSFPRSAFRERSWGCDILSVDCSALPCQERPTLTGSADTMKHAPAHADAPDKNLATIQY